MVVQVILGAEEISARLETMAEQVLGDMAEASPIALVGIRSRGELLAQRLQRILQDKGQSEVALGTLDITLYRDDLNQMGAGQPTLRSTEIEFDLNDRHVVLVDDVLWTGRSIRAALDALMALGRPRVIRLAVLIDRQQRQLPIQADFVGQAFEAAPGRTVHVYLHEVDGKDEVIVD